MSTHNRLHLLSVMFIAMVSTSLFGAAPSSGRPPRYPVHPTIAHAVRKALCADCLQKADTSTTTAWLHSVLTAGHDKCINNLFATPALNGVSTDNYVSCDSHQRTILHRLARSSHERSVLYLRNILERVGNTPLVSRPDIEGNTALHYAALRGCAVRVAMLVEHQGDTPKSLQNRKGETPLHYAAMQGHTQVVLILLDNSIIEPDTQDHEKRTALHWAAAYGYTGCIDLLREHCNAALLDKNDKTAEQLARQFGYGKAAQKLSNPTPRGR